MKPLNHFITSWLIATLCAGPAFADDKSPAELPAEPVVELGPAEASVALSAGEPAPFPGVLYSEPLVMKNLGLGLKLEEAELRVAARDRALAMIEADLASEKTKSWTERNRFVLGFTAGIIFSAVTIWGAVQAAELLDK